MPLFANISIRFSIIMTVHFLAKSKKITIDLRESIGLGVAAKCVELLDDLEYRNFQVKLIGKYWGESAMKDGLTYDNELKRFNKGSSIYLWDAAVHPKDYFENFIIPSFDNIHYIPSKRPMNLLDRSLILIKSFSPTYITNIDYVSMHLDSLERKRYMQQKLDGLLESFDTKTIASYLIFAFRFLILSRLKIFIDSKGHRFKLSPSMNHSAVDAYIEKAKSVDTVYVVLSASYDTLGKFECQEDRRKGILYEKYTFESLVNYVKELDKYALQGKIKFILASKKAVDWENIIQSEFLDLRNFEQEGFTLSETLYIIQELASMSLNWPNTFCTWITSMSNILHLTWCSDKDAAKWARNNLHHQPVKNALKLISAIRE